VYRLKAGEALYSAVVVRFTGRVEAEDVNQIAGQLIVLNNIPDETQIPVGAEIRIPLEMIDEAFFTAPAPPRMRSRRGHFQHVILDAGHGGNDPGTLVRGLREDEIAFDLMKRLQAGLVKRGLRVHTLVSTYNNANKTTNGEATREGRRHQYVKVMPAYNMSDSRVGLNLRIYLIEDIYERLLRQGVKPEEIVFISIHLDHLHPAVGGSMVYIPETDQRLATFRATGEVYDKFSESHNQTISFDAQQNQFAESASEAFAQTLIASLRRAQLPVHAYQPIRGYVYRGGDKWTPGIIRYSRVPASVLIEAANLAHRADWQRMRSTDFRQRWAEAIVRAITTSSY
jgi:N-acetylmuramoyl-L-alanine amidase